MRSRPATVPDPRSREAASANAAASDRNVSSWPNWEEAIIIKKVGSLGQRRHAHQRSPTRMTRLAIGAAGQLQNRSVTTRRWGFGAVPGP